MNNNAISVANEFIELAKKNGVKDLTVLKLLKLVYIAHGFGLSLFKGEKLLIDPRFDTVEAWKYGPVIPSVYHTFKQYRNTNITEKGIIFSGIDSNGDPVACTPILEEDDAKSIVRIVWKRYGKSTARELVDLTHMGGTPWSISYKEGLNKEIPDSLTKMYYDSVIKLILENNGKRN